MKPRKSKNEPQSTRDAFGEALLELGAENPNIVVLTADLTESTRADLFAEKFPERFINVGVAEQNLASVSAGLALTGKIPFMTSFGVFSPGRNWDQIRLSICYNNANVKIISTHCGINVGPDGATHQALEDIALIRTLPNMTVLSPCDYFETKEALKLALKIEGPVYLRLTRAKTPIISLEGQELILGGIKVLKNGTKAALVGTGPILFEGIKAAQEINRKFPDTVKVISCPTLKPIDEKSLINALRGIDHVFTLEEHQISGGLGSLVCEILAKHMPKKVTRLGINDTFGQSGSYEDLKVKYGLDKNSIKETILDEMKA